LIVDMKDMNYKKYFVSGLESGAQKERDQIVDHLKDMQGDAATLQQVISWIEAREEDSE